MDKAEGIIVVPNWPHNLGTHCFLRLLVKEPVIICSSPNLLPSRFRKCLLMANSLTPVAARLSGKAFETKKVPKEAIPTVIDSLAPHTLKQYNSAFQAWWLFCQKENIGVYSAGIPEVISFLQQLLNTKKWSYWAFNSLRSALSLILPGEIGKYIYIRRFLRSISKTRPSKQKYNVTWDP